MMSDMRDPEPKQRELDFTGNTTGFAKWESTIYVYVYSSLKNEKVYSRSVLVTFHAENMKEAFGFSQSIAETINAAHDVWEAGVNQITTI